MYIEKDDSTMINVTFCNLFNVIYTSLYYNIANI